MAYPQNIRAATPVSSGRSMGALGRTEPTKSRVESGPAPDKAVWVDHAANASRRPRRGRLAPPNGPCPRLRPPAVDRRHALGTGQEMTVDGGHRPGEVRAGNERVGSVPPLTSDSPPPGPAPPGSTETGFRVGDLAAIRRFVARRAQELGLEAERLDELRLVVTELAANSAIHSGGPGTLRMWSEGDAVVCEVSDRGRIADPGVCRHPPPLDAESGRGLWVVNQLADRVELRTGTWGSNVRIYMAHPERPPAMFKRPTIRPGKPAHRI